VIDPIHGSISLPQWLIRIKDEPPIRRTINIKQLGLKAWVDFPGAIHTRYLHSLGTMHLAAKLTDLLIKKEERRSYRRSGLLENLRNNKNSLMAASFFHDIGHGPFSHVLDYVLEKEFHTTHEKITCEIVKQFKDDLVRESIPVDHVNNIIRGEHDYPYLADIVNGPLDVDKVDYILRDSYHVGLKYSFDLDHFLDQITILGEGDELGTFELGLEKDLSAIACATVFLLLWTTMYDIVYCIQNSRIAEKMLEKAILIAIQTNKNLKEQIRNLKKYQSLDEWSLMRELQQTKGFPEEIVSRIRRNDLYHMIYDEEISGAKEEGEISFGGLQVKPTHRFYDELQKRPDEVAEELSRKLNEGREQEYDVICDIVERRVPEQVHLAEKNEQTGEPFLLSERSDVVYALEQERIHLKLYVHPERVKDGRRRKNKILGTIKELLEAW